MAVKERVKRVELYLNECYPCHSKKYLSLYDWYISLGLPLGDYQACRIPLSREWLDYARRVKKENGIDAPFVVVYTDKGKYIYSYESFIKEGMKVFSKKDQDKIRNDILVKKIDVVSDIKTKRKKTKKTAVKEEEVVSTSIEE